MSQQPKSSRFLLPSRLSSPEMMRRLLLNIARYVPAAAVYGTLATGFARRWPLYWGTTEAATLVFYSVAAYGTRRAPYRTLAVLAWGLLAAGLVELGGLPWLHLIFLPYVLLSGRLMGPTMAVCAALAVPFLEVRHLLAATGPALHGELALIAVVGLAAAIIHGFQPSTLEDTARVETDDLTVVSPQTEPDEDIRETVNTLVATVRPETASLFLWREGELSLRCSTDPGLRMLSEGLVHQAAALKQSIISNRVRREHLGPGYAGAGRVGSLVAAPVLDGAIAVGVLAADSSEEGAFPAHAARAVELFAGQIARILRNRRLQRETERSQEWHAVLLDESPRFATSLELDDVVKVALNAMERITSMAATVLLREGDEQEGKETFRLEAARGVELPQKPEERVLSLEQTLAGMAVTDRQPIYLSNLKGHRQPVLPGLGDGAAATFVLPLVHLDDVLGVVIFFSDRTDPLTSAHIENLQALGNQAVLAIQNARLHARIRRMAVTDGLTGLLNHKTFHERLGAELVRYDRTNEPVSLLLIDIDHFKNVNDTFGHPAGDEVLRGVARIIHDTVREVDVAARYGGEEFAALLIGTHKPGAARLAERLRKNVKQERFETDAGSLSVTVSIGIASCGEDARSTEELIAKADQALYQAKEAGRDKVVRSGERA